MTPERILEVIEIYRELFTSGRIGKIDYPHDKYIPPQNYLSEEVLEHCHGMLDPMIEFVRQGKIEKAFRWLGFIQGVLWSHRWYTLDELKDHNRMPEPKRKSGANGMHEGDRVVYTLTGQHGRAGEFLQDGDCYVDFDDGTGREVKWNHLIPEST